MFNARFVSYREAYDHDDDLHIDFMISLLLLLTLLYRLAGERRDVVLF